MKAIKQRFHKEIIKKHKYNIFATIRKENLEFQQFNSLYNQVLDNDLDLNSLVEKLGDVVFYKHIDQILDEKLYQKLYQNEKYFLNNLSFVYKLLSLQILPLNQVQITITGLSEIIMNYSSKLTALNMKQIFQILQCIIESEKYLPQSLPSIQSHQIIANLYYLIIQKQMEEYLFKIIRFCKIISDPQITRMKDHQLINCLQIHILTSKQVEEIYVSYSFMAQVFDRFYSKQQQLFEYGSILDKTMKDFFNQRLIDPISYFLLKVINNQSVVKLLNQMNILETLIQLIQEVLLKKNQISIFGHHSVWTIFKKIIEFPKNTDCLNFTNQINWISFNEKLENYQIMKYPYVKSEILSCLKQLSKTNLNHIFEDFIKRHTDEQEQIQI